jgi:hypothetical protein
MGCQCKPAFHNIRCANNNNNRRLQLCRSAYRRAGLTNVRCWRESGRHLLGLSILGLTRTSRCRG